MRRPAALPLASLALAAAPVALYAGVAAAWADRELFYALVAEDRWFEWMQVAGYGVAMVGLAALAVVVRRRSRQGAGAAVALALLFAVVIGEEMSWGQRQWDVRLAAVERVNAQGDLTLHNVGAGLALSQLGLLAVALAGAAAPFAYRVVPAAARFRPPPWLAGWFLSAAAFTLARLTVVRSPSFQVAKLSEVAELTVAAGVAVLTVLAVRAAVVPVAPGGQMPQGGAAAA